MKQIITLLLLALQLSAFAQKPAPFSYKFYGFVRTDVYYNSRKNVESLEGIFYQYPMNESLDAEGNDMNAVPNKDFFSFASRLGLDITGPRLLGAATSAKLETDFGGFSTSNTMLRIRQAYFQLKWEKQSLLVGQTWHPMWGDVIPTVVNLNTGCPFQPFNRSPMIRFQQSLGKEFTLTAAAVQQFQYLSNGPKGKTIDYVRYSLMPELYAGVQYANPKVKAGIGLDILSITPRTESTLNNKVYKVKENNISTSLVGFASYTENDWLISAKSTYGQNLAHQLMLGGYGVKSIDKKTGEQEYTNFNHSSSWINIVYGKTLQFGGFAGYTKNLGTNSALVDSKLIYGQGTDIDNLYQIGVHSAYRLPNWLFGVEYSFSRAAYGDFNLETGRIINTHGVSNHRVLAAVSYLF